MAASRFHERAIVGRPMTELTPEQADRLAEVVPDLPFTEPVDKPCPACTTRLALIAPTVAALIAEAVAAATQPTKENR